MKKAIGNLYLVFSILACTTAVLNAADRELLYGEWGTETQCARALITPKGTKLAEPFDIQKDWLGHGDLWCRLNWGTLAPEPDGLFTTAQAACGEDAVRGYNINFRLDGQELTLVWNLWHRVGPLRRCSA